MQNNLSQAVEKHLKKHSSNMKKVGLVAVLAAFVLVGTVYTLVRPASTLEQDTYCGLQEHEHTSECYEGEVLICDEEEHTHTLACYSNPDADKETATIWENSIPGTLDGTLAENLVEVAKSQLGYTESNENYVVSADNSIHGYTRYGQWAGQPYADWNSIFVNFCLNYASQDQQVPYDEDYSQWIAELNEKAIYQQSSECTPVAGDLVFFDNNADLNADGVGIIESIKTNEDNSITLKVIEGDSNNKVECNSYALDDSTILGYAVLAQSSEDEIMMIDEDLSQVAETVEDSGEADTPVMLSSINGDTYYDSDLSMFLTDVIMEDGSASTVNALSMDEEEEETSTTVYVGAKYLFSLFFSESNESGSGMQFKNNENGYLTYSLYAPNLEITEYHEEKPIYNADGVTIAYYTLTKDSETGNFVIQVRFLNVDDNGKATDKVYFENSSSTKFQIDFTATVVQKGEETKLVVNFNNEISIDAKISKAGALTTEKKGDYKSWTNRLYYQYVVKVTEGSVYNIVSVDTPDEYVNIDASSIKVYNLDGTTERSDIEVTYDSTTHKLTTSAISMSVGEGYIIYYEAIPDLNKYASDNGMIVANVTYNANNTVTVTGKTLDGNEPTATDTATVTCKKNSLTKSGQVVPLVNDEGQYGYYDADGNIVFGTDTGNPVYLIKWTVTLGDSINFLGNPITLTDAYEERLELYKDIPLEIEYTRFYYNEDGTIGHDYPPKDITVDWDDESISYGTEQYDFAGDGDNSTYNTFTIKLSEMTKQYTLTYYTLFNNNDETNPIFRNYVYTDGIHEGFIGREVYAKTGLGVHKEITDVDADYIYFKVTATIPAGFKGQWIWMSDSMSFGGYNDATGKNLEDIDIAVTTASGKTIQFTEQDGTKSEDNTWFFNDRNWIVFNNSTEHNWNIDEASVITMTYKVSKNITNESGTLSETFQSGSYLANTISLNNGWRFNIKDTVYYSETNDLIKNGEQVNGDIEYKVNFVNFKDTSAISYDGTTATRVAELNTDFTNAYLKDTFDDNVQFDTNIQLITMIDTTTGEKTVVPCIKAAVYREGTSLDNPVAWQKRTVFYCPLDKVIIDEETNTFTVNWSDFWAYIDTFKYSYKDSGTTIDGIIVDEAGYLANSWTQVINLEDYMQLNPQFCIQFTYYMQPINMTAATEVTTFHNKALIGWNTLGTDGETKIPYTTKEAEAITNYQQKVISKTGEQSASDNDVMYYTVTINPNSIDLTNNDTLTVQDQMSNNQVLNYTSINILYPIPGNDGKYFNDYASYEDMIADDTLSISNPEVMWNKYTYATQVEEISYDDSNNTVKIVVADDMAVQIVYKTRVNESGDNVKVTNTASLVGYTTVYSVTDETYKVDDSSGSGSSSIQTLTILKQDKNTKKSLGGAVFALYGPEDKTKMGTPEDETIAKTVVTEGQTLYYYTTFTVNEDGKLEGTYILDDNLYLANGGLYTLVEIEAPDGYYLSEPVSFWWQKTASNNTEFKVCKDGDTVLVEDRSNQVLPETGGNELWIEVGGISLMMCAIYCGYQEKRKKNKVNA